MFCNHLLQLFKVLMMEIFGKRIIFGGNFIDVQTAMLVGDCIRAALDFVMKYFGLFFCSRSLNSFKLSKHLQL